MCKRLAADKFEQQWFQSIPVVFGMPDEVIDQFLIGEFSFTTQAVDNQSLYQRPDHAVFVIEQPLLHVICVCETYSVRHVARGLNGRAIFVATPPTTESIESLQRQSMSSIFL